MTDFPLHGAQNVYSPAAYKFRKQLMSSEPVSERIFRPPISSLFTSYASMAMMPIEVSVVALVVVTPRTNGRTNVRECAFQPKSNIASARTLTPLNDLREAVVSI